MPIAIAHSSYKWTTWLLGVLSAICVSPIALYVFDCAYWQWAEEWNWISLFNAHSPLLLPLLAAWVCSIVLLIVAVASWLVNLKRKALRQRLLTGWVLVLAFSSAALLPQSGDFAAATVLLLGPGKNSERLQRTAVVQDSVLLLDALSLRRARIEDSLLLGASAQGSPRVVSRLIRLGTPINKQYPPDNRTALHTAVARKRYDNARVLVDSGARLDIANANGQTPVSLAATMDDREMLKILQRQGAK
jgi:hypothetical protein